MVLSSHFSSLSLASIHAMLCIWLCCLPDNEQEQVRITYLAGSEAVVGVETVAPAGESEAEEPA